MDFWREFPDDDRASIRTMFRALFGGLGLRKAVAIQSVFAHHRTTSAGDRAELRTERYVHVAFSGEAHHVDFADHDLNLVMAADDPVANVVSFIGFGAYAHEYGLWPRFAERRENAADRFCVAVISNLGGGERNRFVPRLHGRRAIDSCGHWINTTGTLAPRDVLTFGDRYLPFLSRYRFMVCFENTRQSLYLTEKLANAYAAGCVPIYWGAPEAPRWLNPAAFLRLEDGSDQAIGRLIDRVLQLEGDAAAYAALHREPLLAGDVPEPLRLDVVRAKIESTLRRSRPDAF